MADYGVHVGRYCGLLSWLYSEVGTHSQYLVIPLSLDQMVIVDAARMILEAGENDGFHPRACTPIPSPTFGNMRHKHQKAMC